MFTSTILAVSLWAASAPKADKLPEKPYAFDTAGTTKALKNGQKGALRLVIKPASGFKISREAPLNITLASKGLELSKSKLGQKDAADTTTTSPEFAVEFTGKQLGPQAIEAHASFFVCNETLCERKTDTLTVAITVDP